MRSASLRYRESVTSREVFLERLRVRLVIYWRRRWIYVLSSVIYCGLGDGVMVGLREDLSYFYGKIFSLRFLEGGLLEKSGFVVRVW